MEKENYGKIIEDQGFVITYNHLEMEVANLQLSHIC